MQHEGGLAGLMHRRSAQLAIASKQRFDASSERRQQFCPWCRANSRQHLLSEGLLETPEAGSYIAAASITTAPSTWTVAANWSASPGADHYKLYRLADGQQSFTYVKDVFGLQTSDSIPAGTVRAYGVVAVDSTNGSPSAMSVPHLAAALSFTAVTSGSSITVAPFNELLGAVNAVRATTGQSAVTWAGILPNGVPVPAIGVFVYGAHVTAIRNALDTARSAIPGLPLLNFSNPVINDPITAALITQLQGGAR
jgi:hypothetical protein